MARRHDAQSTLRALAKYGEAILEAHLTNGNRIPDQDDQQNLIETLEHHRLVWRIGDAEDLQLKRVLVDFLDHITESERRHYASAHVSALWQQLEDLFRQYLESKRRVSLTDVDRLENEIKELLASVIEDIRNSTEAFAGYVTTGFAYVTDIELRIQENKRVIEQAGRLIALFESFRIPELAEQAGNDPFLKRLLLRHLPATLESSQKNLTYTLNNLRQMLVRLREDQRLSRLIGAFESEFANNPGFEPSLSIIGNGHLPEVLNTVAPFVMGGLGDIYDSADDLELGQIAKTARTVEREVDTPATVGEVGAIEFDLGGETATEEPDPVEDTIMELVQLVVEGEVTDPVRASEALKIAGLDIELSDWMQALVSEIQTLPENDRALIDLQFESVPHRLFSGNMVVYNLVVRHRHA